MGTLARPLTLGPAALFLCLAGAAGCHAEAERVPRSAIELQCGEPRGQVDRNCRNPSDSVVVASTTGASVVPENERERRRKVDLFAATPERVAAPPPPPRSRPEPPPPRPFRPPPR